MRKLFITAVLLTSTQMSQANAADMPETVILPTETISEIITYFNTRPYGEVGRVANALQMCIALQLPQTTSGPTVPKEWCAPVATALAARDALTSKTETPK